jgi:molybdopterin-dependent oxidoreductase alpha subunit
MRNDEVDDRSPEVLSDLEVSPPMTTAAGIEALKETLTNTFPKMGPLRATRALLVLNQKGGIDCPSCAWPDPDDKRAIGEFCESGAKALADEAMTAKIDREFWRRHDVAELSQRDDYWLNAQGRLTEPMIRRADVTHYEPISWSDAFDVIARELNGLDSPNEAIFYTSGRTSNEAAFLYQLFARQFGTNNLPDCSNMCHESSGTALTESIGLGKTSLRIDDFEKADLILIIGQNPGTTAPRMMTSLEAAKHNGAKIIAINPLPEAGLLNFVNPNPQYTKHPVLWPFGILFDRPRTQLADLHLALRVGGDMAVLKGIMKSLLERERAGPATVFDHDFIDSKTEGYAALLDTLDATSWNDILDASGLTRGEIDEAASMIAASERMITTWAMGLTQHKDSVATIQDLVNLHLLRGQIGKPGAGVCPVRGHSNVQGDRTMGIWEKVKDEFFDPLEKEFNFKAPRDEGFSTVKAIAAMRDGRAKVFFSMGGNFLSATPDTDVVFEGLKSCRLTVQVATKLNRTALVPSGCSLILPCLGRSERDVQNGVEQFVSTESTTLNVQMSKGVLKPASSDLRSEPWIVCQMAKTTLGDRSTVDWEAMASDYYRIRDSISRVVKGCEDYNKRVRVKGGFYLPNKPHEGNFPTKSGKAEFKSSTLEPICLADGQFLLTTIRSHNQFNTTIYDYSDRYRGIEGERRVVFMNGDDILDHGLGAGQVVDLTSHFRDHDRRVERFIVVPYPIPRRCIAAYFPETNPLVPLDSIADKSETPTSKSLIVSIVGRNEYSGKFDDKVLSASANGS